MQTIRDLPEWEQFRSQMIDARIAPSAVFPDLVKPPAESLPHGPFRRHLDLPLLTGQEAARMQPVWEAMYELVRAHPRGCGCDPTVMAWRASYATAEILLRLPDAEGVYRRRYVGDAELVYGWRCTRSGCAIERTSKALDAGGAHRAYAAHMAKKHPQDVDNEEKTP